MQTTKYDWFVRRKRFAPWLTLELFAVAELLLFQPQPWTLGALLVGSQNAVGLVGVIQVA